MKWFDWHRWGRHAVHLGWQGSSAIWVMVAGFLYSIVLGKLLGVANWGILSLCGSFCSLVFRFAQLPLHEATIRFVAGYSETGRPALVASCVRLFIFLELAFSAAAALLCVMLIPIAPSAIFAHDIGPWLLVGSVVSAWGANFPGKTALGVLFVHGAYKEAALLRITTVSVNFASVLFVTLVMGGGLLGVVVAEAVVSAAAAIGTYAYLRHFLRVRLKLDLLAAETARALKPEMPAIRHFLVHGYLSSLTSMPVRELDITLLGWFCPPAVIGAYAMAKRFVLAMEAATNTLYSVVYPVVARHWARGEVAAIRLLTRHLTAALSGVAVVGVLMAVWVVPLVIDGLLGSGYRDAGNYFRFMVAFMIFSLPFVWQQPLLLAQGRADLDFYCNLGTAVAVMVLYFAAVPVWGPPAAALIFAVTPGIQMGCRAWALHRYCRWG